MMKRKMKNEDYKAFRAAKKAIRDNSIAFANTIKDVAPVYVRKRPQIEIVEIEVEETK